MRLPFLGASIGRCPSTVQPVFPVLVFQPCKQPPQPNLDNLLNCSWTKTFPLEKSFEVVALFVGLPSENPQQIDTFTAWNRTRNRAQTPFASTTRPRGAATMSKKKNRCIQVVDSAWRLE